MHPAHDREGPNFRLLKFLVAFLFKRSMFVSKISKRCSLFTKGAHYIFVLVWVPPEASPETRIQVQVVYLEVKQMPVGK